MTDIWEGRALYAPAIWCMYIMMGGWDNYDPREWPRSRLNSGHMQLSCSTPVHQTLDDLKFVRSHIVHVYNIFWKCKDLIINKFLFIFCCWKIWNLQHDRFWRSKNINGMSISMDASMNIVKCFRYV